MSQEQILIRLPIDALQNIDLSNTDLSYADLSKANLRNTSLRSANLRGINLSNTNLTGADLRRSILIDANLSNANLEHAYLDGADLKGANLRNAKLTGVQMLGTKGNDLEICHKVYGPWIVVWTKKFMAIGCQQHLIEEWRSFDDARISRMHPEALAWWKVWKDEIFGMIDKHQMLSLSGSA